MSFVDPASDRYSVSIPDYYIYVMNYLCDSVIEALDCIIALKFDRRLEMCLSNFQLNFESDAIIQTKGFAASSSRYGCYLTVNCKRLLHSPYLSGKTLRRGSRKQSIPVTRRRSGIRRDRFRHIPAQQKIENYRLLVRFIGFGRLVLIH